jgi:uncharacterized protein involved in cysteine biosynthesis
VKNFIRGLSSPKESVQFIFSNPSLFKYLLLPFLFSVLILSVSLTLWLNFSTGMVTWLGLGGYAFVAWFMSTFAWIIFAIFAMYFFTIFGMIAATPFNDILSRRTLELRGIKSFHELGFISGAKKSLSEVIKLTLIKCIVLGLSLFVPPLSFIMLMFFIGWDYFDYPMNHKMGGLKNKFKFLFTQKAVFIGFACVYTFLFMIPFAGLFLMPLAVISASLLINFNEE